MAQFRRSVKYFLDSGEEVAIQLLYFSNLTISPEARLTAGGFDPNNDIIECGAIITRNRLNPRRILIETEEENKRLDLIVKTRDRFDEIIADPQLGNIGIARRYIGEQFAICTTNN